MAAGLERPKEMKEMGEQNRPSQSRTWLTIVIVLLCLPSIAGIITLAVGDIATVLGAGNPLAAMLETFDERVPGFGVCAFLAAVYGAVPLLLAAILGGLHLRWGAPRIQKWMVLGALLAALTATALFWVFLEKRVQLP